MKHFLTFLLGLLISSFLLSCANSFEKGFSYIRIETAKGDILVKLYNETPRHKENMLKLTRENFFDGLIFHRVIKDFVIQGGDPDTRTAVPDSAYGESDSGYKLDPEFVAGIFHRKGAIAMAREGDKENPEKKSSGSQFYIVVGKIFTSEQLDALEEKRNETAKTQLYENTLSSMLLATAENPSQKVISSIISRAKAVSDSLWEQVPPFKYSPEQRLAYTTLGGLPHLDGNYTVFGEVVKGMDIVEELSKTATDKRDRPRLDLKMKILVEKESR